MRLKTRFFALITTLVLACSVGACGDGGDDPVPDATPDPPDADTTPDAFVPTQLGDTCTTPGEQSDCPADFVCVTTDSGNWCSKACVDEADLTCEDGYTGPGRPLCILDVAGANHCAVVCAEVDPDTICTGFTCDGTCPGALACSLGITNGDGDDGTACE